MTQCNGMNCGTTTGDHSPECRAELSASTEAAAGEPDIAQLALDWVVIARKALKAEPSAADGYYNGYHDALTAPPAATLSTETVDKPVDRLTDEQISTVIDEWYYHADEPVKEKLASFARAILSYSATASDKEQP